jgi:hypothetical protein
LFKIGLRNGCAWLKKNLTKRLKILETEEIEAVYGLPVFDDGDRAFCFSLSPPERVNGKNCCKTKDLKK